MASVATMTGTLIDSGCKHIIPTRVSLDTLLGLQESPDQNVILRDKMKYCAHKNDLLLCVNRPLFKQGRGFLAKNAAYPYVLSTLGGVAPVIEHAIAMYYAFQGEDEIQEDVEAMFQLGLAHVYDENLLPRLTEEEEQVYMQIFSRLPFFTFMGYSLGLAYAHPSSGDNVVSAMVGGMLSVQNGHFQVHTGDLIMWYFDFERPYFTDEGGRPENIEVVNIAPDRGADERRKTHLRENGVYPGGPGEGRDRNSGKTQIAYPKPYVLEFNRPPNWKDKRRVFARAMSNARPFDKLDLLICTQSI